MMTLSTKQYAKAIPATLRRYLYAVSMLAISLTISLDSHAQCTGCTTTINNNFTSATATPGTVICITTAGTYSRTITLSGGTVCISSATNITGATIVYAAASTIINNGTISQALTIGNGYTLTNNSGATISGAITASTGSAITNSGTISGTLTQNGGAFTNNSGGTISGTSSISGTLTNNGTISNTITINNGGLLTNNVALSAAITMATGSTFTNSSTYGGAMTNNGGTINNSGTINGNYTQTGGAVTNASGGTLAPLNPTFSSGSITNNSGGTLTLPSVGTSTLQSGFTMTNNGSMTSGPITVNSGGTLTLNGTQTISGNVSNNGTINLGGSLAINSYSYSGSGTVNETQSGCNTFTVGTNTSTGSFNGGQSTYGGGLIVNSTSGTATLTNGASAVITAPTQQPTGLTLGVSALTVSGSFTSPSASISGYIVLRYIGTSAPSDNPSSYTAYTVGNTIGSSTVVAVISSSSTGTVNFTDNIPSSACGQSVYYRIFSYNGAGECESFYLTGPLTGSIAITIPTAAISPAGPSTFCASGTLTASGGISYLWNATGGSAATAAITASASGTYTVTVTNAAGCTASASNIVSITPGSASITPSGPTTFCASGSVTLTASGGGTYLWSTGATTAAVTASAAGTYTVTVTSASGCTASASQTLTVNPLPAAPTAATATPATMCAGATSQIKATSAGNTINWWTAATGGTLLGTSASGANYAVTPAVTTTYYAESYTAAGCASATRAAVTVTVNPIPAAAISPAGPSLCGTSTLTASGGGTYQWNLLAGFATTAAISVSLSGTYSVTVTSAAGCTASATNTVTINPVPLAPITVTATPATICAGQTSQLSAISLGNTIRWWTAATGGTLLGTSASGANYAVSPVSTTTYYAESYTASGCASASRVAVTVTVNALPAAAITPAGPSTFCGSGILTASGGGTYQWNATGGSATTAAITASASGTYTVTVTSAAGCTAAASNVVTVNTIPTAAISPSGPSSFCVSGTLTASGIGTYQWNTTGGSATTAAITASASGTYTVTVTSAAGCTAAASNVVTVNPYPLVSPITGIKHLCQGGTATLSDATAGGVWSSSNIAIATVSGGVVSGVAAGNPTISYAVTSLGCTTTVTALDTVYPQSAVAAITGTSTICAGNTTALSDATAGGVWTSSDTTKATVSATGVVTGVAAGSPVISYTLTNANGCTNSATIIITVNPTPWTTINNPATCAGGKDTMVATAIGGTGLTYLWSNAITTSSFITTTAGVYSVTVNNSSGCSATATGIATINPLPTPTVNSPSICNGSVATLTATGGVIYAWSTGATTTSITTAAAGTYTVTATNSGSCTATASGTVTIVANPSLTTTNGYICSGAPATLTATSAGSTFVWSTGATTASISTTTAGTYSVTATSVFGCNSSATASASTSTNPTPTVNSPAICAGSSASLTATGGASYIWSTGATTNPITVTPASTTTYTVTASNAVGCSATATGTVTVNARPTPTVNNAAICSGAAATLTATGGVSYHWSTGATTASISTTVVGTYTVTATNAAGCTATASGTVTTAVAPIASVNSPSACNGVSQTLTATLTAGGPCTYLWSNAATTASISVAPGSTTAYTVTVTNASGCTASATGTATVYPLPSVTAGSNSPILLGATINLTSTVSGGTSGYTYSWSGPNSYTSTTANPTITAAQPVNSGYYYITVTDAHTCTATTYTIAILNFASPGGIPSNDALWLKADTGVSVSGSNVTKWNDMSGLANNAPTVNGTAPTLVSNSLNYHPVVNFTGNGGLQGAFGTAITSNSTSAFIVTNTAASNPTYTGVFSIANTTGNNTDYNSNSTACVFMTGGSNEMATYRNGFLGNYTNANALGSYHMFSSLFSSTANTNYFYTEGANNSNGAFSSSNFGSGMYTIGSRWANALPSLYLNGQIAEVILFNTQVTTAQRNQVESYLATKYGFTLNQSTATNYVASDGAIFWNASSNGTYKNNIFGVGIDNISTLKQTQSVSVNTNQLSINSATGLTYYSFLMVSDNAAGLTLNQASGLPNQINAKVSTVWRVSQTGTRCSANYVFNTSGVSYGYYAPIASSMTPYMLIDSNADGIYETYLPATSTSGTNITFNAYLRDGALFTFGFKASIDYGDAWSVPTLTANNGAGHLIVPGVYLGSLIDAEVDGQPSVNALGDDTIGLADEDGVNFNIGVPTTSNIVTMGSNTITVTASVPGYLNAWADFNQDGTYGGGSEYAIQNLHLSAGANTVTFMVSDSVEYGSTSMRFRFDTINGDVTAPTGLAKNGEVEDYKIYVTAPLVGPCTNGFQNPSFEQGPDLGSGYIVTSETNLPYWRTTASDHMIEQWYNGYNGIPSYNGNYFVELEANLYGALYQDVYTTPGTKLSWSFAHHGRLGSDTCQLLIGPPGAAVYQTTAIDGNTAWGVHSGYYTVPAGQYITRLEFLAVGSAGGDQSIGNELDEVSVQSSFDYGDAPNSYGTLFANSGPYHNILSTLYLGYGVTCDADGKPSAAANLDSLDDGITFPTACASCNTYTVNVAVYNNSGSPATIAGWIDFNKNGVFDNNERASITVPSSASEQFTTMTFTVNAFSASSASTYARFRIANDSTQIATPYGFAASGEVEDYLVPCVSIPPSIPSASPGTVCKGGTLTLTSTGTAPYYAWSGPNGFISSTQNNTINNVPFADSGSYRVYAVYANGCEVDSAVKVTVQSCYVNVNGNIFDDANGDGIINGSDATTDLTKTIYAVLSDNTNTVLAKSLIAANGAFSFTSVPAYTSGMTIVASTTNPSVGATSGGPLWPTNWAGTKENYGTNNLAGTGISSTPNLVGVNTGVINVTGILMGFDQLPTTTLRYYTIAKPARNSQKNLTPANGLGLLAGADAEDGIYTSGNTFIITSLAGMNGNTLYYDANGDGVLQAYEQITAYTTITNFDPTKLYVKFIGAASTSATFYYSSLDAANKPASAPTTYTITWVGPLPVKLMYFNADMLGTDQSLLTWATASEINNAYFAVERSADAQEWDSIGTLLGAGTTDVQTNYKLIDPQPLPGVNYYRLKQVDDDGVAEYSQIASVTFNTEANNIEKISTLKVYPNPMNQSSKLNIELNSQDETISNVTITNEIGQTVYNTNLPEIQDYQIFGLDLPSGVYIVSVRTQNNNLLTSRLVIAR